MRRRRLAKLRRRATIGDNSGRPSLQPIVIAPRFLPLYFSFAAAYVLSYTYRTANAVISPELSASLNIGASSLGLLTSAYFVAFAAMQIPAVLLLDCYVPRRVVTILLTIASGWALDMAYR